MSPADRLRLDAETRETFRRQLERLRVQVSGKRPDREIGARSHATGHMGTPRWEPNGTVPWGQE